MSTSCQHPSLSVLMIATILATSLHNRKISYVQITLLVRKMLVVAYLKVIIQGFDWRFKKTRNIFFFNISRIKVRNFGQEFRNFKQNCYLSVKTIGVSICSCVCVLYLTIYKRWQLQLIHKTLNRKLRIRFLLFEGMTLIWRLKVVLPKLPNFAFAVSRKHIRMFVQSLILSVSLINSSIPLLKFSKNFTYYTKAFYFWEYITCCYGRKNNLRFIFWKVKCYINTTFMSGLNFHHAKEKSTE